MHGNQSCFSVFVRLLALDFLAVAEACLQRLLITPEGLLLQLKSYIAHSLSGLESSINKGTSPDVHV